MHSSNVNGSAKQNLIINLNEQRTQQQLNLIVFTTSSGDLMSTHFDDQSSRLKLCFTATYIFLFSHLFSLFDKNLSNGLDEILFLVNLATVA